MRSIQAGIVTGHVWDKAQQITKIQNYLHLPCPCNVCILAGSRYAQGQAAFGHWAEGSHLSGSSMAGSSASAIRDSCTNGTISCLVHFLSKDGMRDSSTGDLFSAACSRGPSLFSLSCS